MSLRLRIAVAAALSILLAAVLLGAAVIVFAKRDLDQARDRSLRDRAVSIEQLVATAPELVTRPGALETSLAESGTSVQVVDRHGAIVARSSALEARPIPDLGVVQGVLKSGHATSATVALGGDDLRLFVAPLPSSAAAPLTGGAVIVAVPTAADAETLEHLRNVVLVAAALAAILAAAISVLLSRRALRPLSALSTAAAEIGRTRDPEQRLPVPAADDEVGRLTQTLNEMLAELSRASEEERRFVGDVSHELRTPLTALHGNAIHAASHGADDALLADIAADADRLARLVDDLLALTRQDTGDRPRELVHLDELAFVAAESSPLVQVEAGEPIAVRGDREALLRAVENLVSNALRYGPQGSPVTITVERLDTVARLVVRDAGPGPSAADSARIFDRFWRGRGAARAPGSGLGLAIVRATVERHGGSVHVRGSAFAIELPALVSSPGLIDPSESPGTPSD